MEGNTLKLGQDDLSPVQQQVIQYPNTDPWSGRIRLGIVVFAVFWLFLVGAMWSRAAQAEVPATDSEYSFKWLDPEKKIYVLQNRRYLKANRLLVSGMAGPGFSNPYRNTFSVEPRLAYYFTEQWGLEVFYNKTFNTQNNTYRALLSTNTTVFPVVRELRSELGVLAQWVPWYAKINVFNEILYFDWDFHGGVGSVESAVTSGTDQASLNNYVTQNKLGFFLGTGHQYHVSENFVVRLDFMGSFYQAPLSGTTGDNVWFTNYNISAGFGVRL